MLQIATIRQHLQTNLAPPILSEEYLRARYNYYSADRGPTSNEIEAIVAVGNYWGALLRTTYLRFVRRGGYESNAFWNAAIMVFSLGGIWSEVWRDVLKTNRAKHLTSHYSRPDWVSVGLIGADWNRLRPMCEQFCDEMEVKVDAEIA